MEASAHQAVILAVLDELWKLGADFLPTVLRLLSGAPALIVFGLIVSAITAKTLDGLMELPVLPLVDLSAELVDVGQLAK